MKKSLLIISVIVVLVLPFIANAQIKDASDQFENLDKNQLVDIALSFAEWFLIVLGVLAVIMVLYGAFLYIIAGGQEDNIKKAKNVLIYAIIGVVVAILAFSVVAFTKSLFEPPGFGSGGGGGSSCSTAADCGDPNQFRCSGGVCVPIFGP